MTGPPHAKSQVSRGLAWIGLGSTLIGALDLAAQMIILHFYFSAAEYGIAALAVTLFPFLDQITDMGLGSAVIQRDDHSRETISTVFWLNVLLSAATFGLLALGAPAYARWQGHPVVGAMLIVYGGKLVFQNVYAIPFAMMKRELRFKELSIIRIVANVGEFAGKVVFAALGFGVWCFVLAAIIRTVIVAVGIQLRHPWRPGLAFDLRKAAPYVRFGLASSASQLLYHFYSNADYPVVSKLFGATALGLYRAAYELVLELVRTIATVFVEVGFPTFARLRHDRQALAEQFIGFTRQILVLIVPFVLVTLVAAEETLSVMWGPHFAGAATATRVLCVVGLLRAFSQLVPPLLDGIGRPSLTLVYHAVCAVLLPALFAASGELLGPRLGHVSVAVAWAVGYPFACGLLVWMALARLELSPLVYARRVVGILGCAMLAAPAGLAAHFVTSGWPALARLAMVAAAVLAVFSVTLARFQDISLRSIWRSVRA